MIKYNITNDELEALIDEKSATWRTRAATHTAKMATAGSFIDKGKPSWSEIKAAYTELQKKKCAYCEKRLEGDILGPPADDGGIGTPTGHNIGAIEQDVEHYRPKNGVKAWTPKAEVITFPTGDGTTNGYYMLAFDIWNYCMSCKTCNTSYKSNYFPIEGTTGTGAETDIVALNEQELPFLIYPLGDLDQDPESILAFRGYQPVAVASTGRDNRRANVTIDFFDLDVRETLIGERCDVIRSMYGAMLDYGSDEPGRHQRGADNLAISTSSREPHTNCARSYQRLFVEDLAAAQLYYDRAMEYLMRDL